MLLSLDLENVFLVKKSTMNFCSEFNVLTGETGSGKSIALSALLCLFGRKTRLNKDNIVKVGAELAKIEAVFDLSKMPKAVLFLQKREINISDFGKVLFVMISSDGKQKFLINGLVASKLTMKEIGNLLIEVSNQHDKVALLNSKNFVSILDMYANLESDVSKLGKVYSGLLEVRGQFEKISAEQSQSDLELNYIRHVVSEISEMDLKENEEIELVGSKRKIEQGLELNDGLNSLQNLFYNSDNCVKRSVVQGLRFVNNAQMACKKNLSDSVVESGDNDADAEVLLTSIEEKISSVIENLEDIESGIFRSLNGVRYVESDLESINERLFAIRDLARKYKVSSVELNSIKEEMALKLDLVNNRASVLAELQRREGELTSEYDKLAKQISAVRNTKSKSLQSEIVLQLQELHLKDVEFRVVVSGAGNRGSDGVDAVKFMIVTNKGMELEELHKSISGGEMSRVLLALKIIFRSINICGTMIFDEIDSGIGGKVSDVVGLKIKELSGDVQIILITHQPQIASKATKHFRVIKVSDALQNSTVTEIVDLEHDDRVLEIARMISGNVTHEGIKNAEKLLV